MWLVSQRSGRPRKLNYLPLRLIAGMEQDSSDTCLVCLNPCSAFSHELFVYNCDCVYRIHPVCFREWRRITQSDRICLICQESLEPFSDDEQPQQQPRLLQNPGIDAHFDRIGGGCTRYCVKNICVPCTYILIGVYAWLYLYGFWQTVLFFMPLRR